MRVNPNHPQAALIEEFLAACSRLEEKGLPLTMQVRLLEYVGYERDAQESARESFEDDDDSDWSLSVSDHIETWRDMMLDDPRDEIIFDYDALQELGEAVNLDHRKNLRGGE